MAHSARGRVWLVSADHERAKPFWRATALLWCASHAQHVYVTALLRKHKGATRAAQRTDQGGLGGQLWVLCTCDSMALYASSQVWPALSGDQQDAARSVRHVQQGLPKRTDCPTTCDMAAQALHLGVAKVLGDQQDAARGVQHVQQGLAEREAELGAMQAGSAAHNMLQAEIARVRCA